MTVVVSMVRKRVEEGIACSELVLFAGGTEGG